MKLEKFVKKNKIFLVPLLILVGVLALIKEPEFFDYFGVGVFIFMFFSSLYLLKIKSVPYWISLTYFIISCLGLIVDSIIVLRIGG